MDAKNYEYLRNKVVRYEILNNFRSSLNSMQERLLKDETTRITVGGFEGISSLSDNSYEELEENGDLMREIKDDLIDTIGMKIVEINDKMEEL